MCIVKVEANKRMYYIKTYYFYYYLFYFCFLTGLVLYWRI